MASLKLDCLSRWWKRCCAAVSWWQIISIKEMYTMYLCYHVTVCCDVLFSIHVQNTWEEHVSAFNHKERALYFKSLCKDWSWVQMHVLVLSCWLLESSKLKLKILCMNFLLHIGTLGCHHPLPPTTDKQRCKADNKRDGYWDMLQVSFLFLSQNVNTASHFKTQRRVVV